MANATKIDWAYDQAKKFSEAYVMAAVQREATGKLASLLRRASKRNASIMFRKRRTKPQPESSYGRSKDSNPTHQVNT